MADWERVWLSQVDEWWLVREDLWLIFNLLELGFLFLFLSFPSISLSLLFTPFLVYAGCSRCKIDFYYPLASFITLDYTVLIGIYPLRSV